jgi:hypothetical protein
MLLLLTSSRHMPHVTVFSALLLLPLVLLLLLSLSAPAALLRVCTARVTAGAAAWLPAALEDRAGASVLVLMLRMVMPFAAALDLVTAPAACCWDRPWVAPAAAAGGGGVAPVAGEAVVPLAARARVVTVGALAAATVLLQKQAAKQHKLDVGDRSQ